MPGRVVRGSIGTMTDTPTAESVILRLCAERGPTRSICPSEAARLLASETEWRTCLPAVRAAAVGLAHAGRIDILRKGRRIAPEDMRGVIRLRLPES